MKNLTKALVASGLLLSISGCNQQVMDCLQDSASQIYGIDGSGTPLTINGIDGSGNPFSINGIDGSGNPNTSYGIDGSGAQTGLSAKSEQSIMECINKADINLIRGIDGSGNK